MTQNEIVNAWRDLAWKCYDVGLIVDKNKINEEDYDSFESNVMSIESILSVLKTKSRKIIFLNK